MGRNRLLIGASVGLVLIVAGYFLWRTSYLNELKDKGLEQAKRGDFAQAEPTLIAALDRTPSDIDVLQALARGYVKSGRKAEAEEFLTRWLALAPQEHEALLMRQELYRELGQFDKALRDSDKLLEVDANNSGWRRTRVALLVSAGRLPEAETECQRCLQKQPGDRALRGTLAEIKKARGNVAEAAAILDAILREAPGDTPTMLRRATLHLHQDEPEKAIPLLREVLKLDPKLPVSSRYYLGLALNRVGKTEEAAQFMEETRRMVDAGILLSDSKGQPDNQNLQLRAARAQFENGKLDQAEEILRRLLSSDPSCAPAHALMAEVLEQRRRGKANP